LDGIKTSKLGSVFAFGMDGKTAYLYSFFVLFFVFVLLKRLVHSPFGLALRGLREGASRMPAIGVSVRRTQVAVFTVAAGIAGIAGALLAQTTQFVGIDVLGFSRSAELLIMVVLGGAGRLYGAVVGAVVYMIAQDVLSGFDHVYWQFWIGLLLVVLVLAARGGIMGGVAAARARVFKVRR
jgi:branched-chain amino acid transport system permease protein